MPIHPLPVNPSLENLRKQAKELLQRVRAGDAEALAQVREFHPRAVAALRETKLSDAQLVTARRYGFASWAKLKTHIEAIQPFMWKPPTESLSLPDEFIRLACVDYEGWNLRQAEKAREMFAEHPELAEANIHAAAAIGNADFVRRNASLANVRGGPHHWVPLLYACYSRLDDRRYSTLEVARVLLEQGADANAGFLWHGHVPPFTALTGAFGDGEAGIHNPPHPQCDALARLLLDAGADPNDDQTLYNRQGRRDNDHLLLLFAYGLGQDRGGPWFKRFGERLLSPAQMLVEQLWTAARSNNRERVELLVEHGADVNGRSFRDSRTPYDAAVRAGNDDIAAYLLAHGATKTEMSEDERFVVALVNGRRDEVRGLLDRDPTRIENMDSNRRLELLQRAVEAKRPDGVRLMAELGFEINGIRDHDGVGANLAATPLHNAAWSGNLEMVRLLLDLGADAGIRDPKYHGTPLDWAAFNGKSEVVEYLRNRFPS